MAAAISAPIEIKIANHPPYPFAPPINPGTSPVLLPVFSPPSSVERTAALIEKTTPTGTLIVTYSEDSTVINENIRISSTDYQVTPKPVEPARFPPTIPAEVRSGRGRGKIGGKKHDS
jgi:hypothetical protein